MSCESSLSALRLKEVREFSSCVFSSPVGAQAFDVNAMLSLRPCGKAFVHIECLVLGAENRDLGVAGVIVSECHIILASP